MFMQVASTTTPAISQAIGTGEPCRVPRFIYSENERMLQRVEEALQRAGVTWWADSALLFALERDGLLPEYDVHFAIAYLDTPNRASEEKIKLSFAHYRELLAVVDNIVTLPFPQEWVENIRAGTAYVQTMPRVELVRYVHVNSTTIARGEDVERRSRDMATIPIQDILPARIVDLHQRLPDGVKGGVWQRIPVPQRPTLLEMEFGVAWQTESLPTLNHCAPGI